MSSSDCSCCEEVFSHYMNCKDGASHKTTALSAKENAKTWAQGIAHLLQSPYGTALFRAFLKREYAEENLDFVLKVDAYRKDPTTPKRRQQLAWKLYKTYIAIGAPHELNLDMMSRRVTDLAMITPHLTTFDAAQKRVLNLLENDAYMRFLAWDVYLRLVAPDDGEEPEADTKL